MEQRLERADIHLILGCVAVAALSLVVGTHFFYEAFPEATIDFRITRDEARVRAASFLEQRGLDLSGYRQAAIFEFDDEAKTFLERELGLEGASAVIGAPVRLWRWSNRWFRELEKEELRVEHTTAGELVGFSHLVKEEASGARLTQAEGRALAEEFLGQSLGMDLSRLEFVEAETTERPNRVDHSFTWKLAGFDIHEATYRYRVRVQGDRVGGYDEYLKVPEAWSRRFEEMQSRNQTTGLVAWLFLFLTWVAMLVRLVSSIRAQDVRWKTVLAFGAIAFTLTFLSQLNVLPVTVYGFDTRDSYSSFLTDSILAGLAAALAQALLVAFVIAGGEPEYRRGFADHVSLSEQFRPDGIRTKRFLLGTVIGLTLTALFVAYQTVFYLVAERFGAWSPADIPYREMVNTHIPWVVVLLIGFMPAVSEELTSRAFSIPFFHRLLKRRWLAVAVAALVWGFAHAGYPQQPFYIRGIEVGLAGVAIGYVVIRWGLLPALVWHYTIDALYTALILLRSSSPYFVVSAALSVGLMLLPLAVAVALYVRQRFFIDPVSLLNREDAMPQRRPPAAARSEPSPEAQILSSHSDGLTYHPLRPARIATAALVVVAGLGVFLFEHSPSAPEVDFALTAEQARTAALSHLTARGVAVDAFHTVVERGSAWDGRDVEYRCERRGPQAAVALYREGHLAPALWQVRLYQPLQKEEWKVRVRTRDGSIYSTAHALAEEAAGADLSEGEARAVAESHLREYGLEPGSFVLKESSSEKLPQRRDHWFVWEASPGDPRNLDESYFRCQVRVSGDRAAGLERHAKLPEEWLRLRDEGTLWRTALRWVLVLTAICVTLHLLWLLVGQIRAGALSWRWPLRFGLLGSGLFFTSYLNRLPTLYGDYPTAIPPGLFTVTQVVIAVMLTLVVGLLFAAGSGLATTLYTGVLDRLATRDMASQLRDAVLLSGLAVAGNAAVERLGQLLAAALPLAAPPPRLDAPAALDSFWPAVDGLTGAVTAGLATPLVAAVAAFYAVRVLRRPSLVVLVVLVLGAAAAGADVFSAPRFFYDLAGFTAGAAAAAAAMAWLYRDNVAAYVLTGFLTASAEGGLWLLEQSAPAYRAHGWIWLATALAVAALTWLLSARAAAADRPR